MRGLKFFFAFTLAVAFGCGQTSQDANTGGHAGSASGGTGAAGGSGGVGANPNIECAGSHWTRLASPPGARDRMQHPAVASGKDQIVIWGGFSVLDGRSGTGWRIYSDGSIVSLPSGGAPSPRASHAFDVVGGRLLVWGGDNYGVLDDGGALDLESDQWTPLPSPGSMLAPRSHAFSAGVGQGWLVWGGWVEEVGEVANGALYDPGTGSWNGVAEDAPAASELIIEIAFSRGNPETGPAVFGYASGSGYRYDASSGKWFSLPMDGAPIPRNYTSLTWSPVTSEFIVWGGSDGNNLGDGARFSIVTQTWTPMSSIGAPTPRAYPRGVMLGTKLVIFGGNEGVNPVNTGGIYDVTTDSWEPLPLDECAPPPAEYDSFTAFGNGKQALRWGGGSGGPTIEQGWIFSL